MAYELLKLLVDSQNQATTDQRLEALTDAARQLATMQDATNRTVSELSHTVNLLVDQQAHDAYVTAVACGVVLFVLAFAAVLIYRDRRDLIQRMQALERAAKERSAEIIRVS